MLVDGVFSGGGIKGFALIGAYQALEKKGIIFKRLAGTSAGSLIAAMIAAGYSSDEIIDMMTELELKDLLDARITYLPTALAKWFMLYWKMGLYKGDKLENWIDDKLSQKGIRTFSNLETNTLQLIASDLTNGKLLVLPNDLAQYGINPLTFSVAKAVRMSCSLPYFFEPVKLKTDKGKIFVVDGGVLSNFPIFLFDEENKIKKRPVLGIKLSAKMSELKPHKIDNAIDLFAALFDTMKVSHDARYISRRHEKNIIFIPIQHMSTTGFQLDEGKKDELIKIGRDITEQFLKTWCS
jgi:NTE family protein